MGWELCWARADSNVARVRFQPVLRMEPCLGEGTEEKKQRAAALRVAMTIHAAGIVANLIHQQAVEARGFTSGAESRAYENYWRVAISVRFGAPMMGDDPVSDYSLVARDAKSVCMAFKPMPVMKQRPDGTWVMKAPRKSKPVSDERVRSEIQKAERAAERILKKHWSAVEDIAIALHKTKSGRLYRKQLLTRLEKHGVEAAKVGPTRGSEL